MFSNNSKDGTTSFTNMADEMRFLEAGSARMTTKWFDLVGHHHLPYGCTCVGRVTDASTPVSTEACVAAITDVQKMVALPTLKMIVDVQPPQAVTPVTKFSESSFAASAAVDDPTVRRVVKAAQMSPDLATEELYKLDTDVQRASENLKRKADVVNKQEYVAAKKQVLGSGA